MSNGISIVSPVNYTRGFKIPADRRIHDGTLLLIEPARDGGGGVPESVVNYAAENTLAITGSAVEALPVVNDLSDYSGCLMERTAKGGLHGVVRTTAFGTHSPRARCASVVPEAVYNYIRSNPTHSIYFGLIGRVTRAPGSGATGGTYALGGVVPYDSQSSNPTGLGVMVSRATGNVAGYTNPGNEFFINRRVSVVQPYFADVAISGNALPEFSGLVQGNRELFTFGERINNATHVGWPSHIIYTLWLEDLTVSGRSYDEASAEGLAAFNERFSESGVYHGDTWTSPASVT